MDLRKIENSILDHALAMFNEFGWSSVSTNRISTAAGISKGHLHYYFPNKSEIIVALYMRMDSEMRQWWRTDRENFTMEHMARMFIRQVVVIEKYKFLYRDIGNIIRDNKILKGRFTEVRSRRMKETEAFVRELVNAGLLENIDVDPVQFDYFIKATWVLSDYWMTHVDASGIPTREEAYLEGYHVLINQFMPYLTESGKRALAEVDLRQILQEQLENFRA
ncbi:TetR/AcrR family transcriptional regulator [Rhizorhabdus wittichii]|uniref:Transcriptional regulator, TetR family n=1 Tax=Rhizorhabdus wittichii (strain DSM 6014 / CCUG 31198 / JCM 15750 / NBRC 105917 / EY 4224 / RW1) TaxID=392499 RepID=A0A9J9HF00_RHIWR|nr:TetR/AcrR family transcriptional regulator [Rhizorhabdus wittichii]ABQ70510.1 transcriptional regulator, TetR family [Rhizorhabdus wittichii RW1]